MPGWTFTAKTRRTLRVRARISWHFGASAGRADARRRDAGDVVTSSRSGNAADARPPPRPSGLRPAGPLAALLAPYIPQRVCSSLAPCQRAWGPAAKCTPYFLTGPKLRNPRQEQDNDSRNPVNPVILSRFF